MFLEWKFSKLFIIGLKKKIQWWSGIVLVTLYFFFLISNSVTTSSNLYNFFSAGLINEKKYKQTDDRPFFC